MFQKAFKSAQKICVGSLFKIDNNVVIASLCGNMLVHMSQQHFTNHYCRGDFALPAGSHGTSELSLAFFAHDGQDLREPSLQL